MIVVAFDRVGTMKQKEFFVYWKQLIFMVVLSITLWATPSPTALAGGGGGGLPGPQFRTVIIDYVPRTSGPLYAAWLDKITITGGERRESFKGGTAFQKTFEIPSSTQNLLIELSTCSFTMCGMVPGTIWGPLPRSCNTYDDHPGKVDCVPKNTHTQKATYSPTTANKTIRCNIRDNQISISEE